ncbi:MAG: hypothetical protein WCJ58_00175 [bacterium]
MIEVPSRVIVYEPPIVLLATPQNKFSPDNKPGHQIITGQVIIKEIQYNSYCEEYGNAIFITLHDSLSKLILSVTGVVGDHLTVRLRDDVENYILRDCPVSALLQPASLCVNEEQNLTDEVIPGDLLGNISTVIFTKKIAADTPDIRITDLQKIFELIVQANQYALAIPGATQLLQYYLKRSQGNRAMTFEEFIQKKSQTAEP